MDNRHFKTGLGIVIGLLGFWIILGALLLFMAETWRWGGL
jgi:hypothetical protein